MVWLSLGAGGTRGGGDLGYTGGGARSQDPEPELGVCNEIVGLRSSPAVDVPGC